MPSPEREGQPEAVKSTEEYKVPEKLVDTGIEATEKAFTATVKDKKGQNLIQTPATKQVTVQLPSDQPTLTTQAKGSTTSSATWFASFWLRMVKRALHFGWKIAGRGESK